MFLTFKSFIIDISNLYSVLYNGRVFQNDTARRILLSINIIVGYYDLSIQCGKKYHKQTYNICHVVNICIMLI